MPLRSVVDVVVDVIVGSDVDGDGGDGDVVHRFGTTRPQGGVRQARVDVGGVPSPQQQVW